MRTAITWKRFFHSNLFFVISAAALLLLSVSLTRAQIKDRAIRREIARLQSGADELEREQASYQALIALVESPEFLESEARRSLGYAKPGERVVVIEERGQQEQQELRDLSNPRKWWVYFFGD